MANWAAESVAVTRKRIILFPFVFVAVMAEKASARYSVASMRAIFFASPDPMSRGGVLQ